MSEAMTKPPAFIWLQWFGSGDADEVGPVSEGDVSWCRDKIWDVDFRYQLVTVPTPAEADAKRLAEALGGAWCG